MRAARSAGTAATTAFCVAVRLRPSAEAMLETMLGDRTSAISETRLVAMRDPPRWSNPPRSHFNHVCLSDQALSEYPYVGRPQKHTCRGVVSFDLLTDRRVMKQLLIS